MKMNFPNLLVTLLVAVGCSKTDSITHSSTPTPSVTVTPTVSPTNTPTSSPLADVNTRLRDLENKMDAIFADTYRGMSTWFDQATRARSVDLREQNDKYIARLYVPNGDNPKVDAKIENGVLHITAENKGTTNGTGETERYEHFITLAKPVQPDKVNVEKKNDVIVISVPKITSSAPAVAAASSKVPETASPSGGAADWAGTMLDQMNQMQARLNQAVSNIFESDTTLGASTSQLGSAMNIEDQNDKYIIHFYLPDKNLSDVNVKFENNQVHLTAQEENKSDAAAGDRQSMNVTRYETVTTLPAPVKGADMKVERKEGSVVVTLPKA